MKNLFRISGVILVVLSIFLIHSCKKDKPSPPVITAIRISSISYNTAISGGNVIDDGGAVVTVRGVCWSTTSNPTTSDNITLNGSGIGAFTSSITGLTANTIYYLKAYATNSIGTTYANQIVFTTTAAKVPFLITTAASSITQTTATSGGLIASDGGTSVTARGVCWSTSANPTIALSTKTIDNTGTGVFTSSIEGLTAGTTYYVRAYATNSVGASYGNEISFTTTSATTPVLTTTAASAITQTTATSGGNITSDGGANVTARGVCWSTTTGPTTALSTKTIDGTGTGTFTSSITGLTGGIVYYLRAYATNSAGTSYGNEVTFTTTTARTVPVLTTTAASAITQTTATSGGNVASDGGASVTERGVCWSTAADPTTVLSTKTSDGTGVGTFTSSITSLTAGTSYFVRAYATNSAGTGYGAGISFSTTATTVPGAPTIGTASAGNAQATITFTAPVSNGGSAIIGYTVTSNPGGKTGTGTASPITVSGLTNGTAYTFTVTATNAIGNSAASSATNSVTPTAPSTVPGAPTGVTASAGNAQATVTFTAPVSNGGSVITGYTVTSNPGNITGTGAASPITVTGLTNGTAHTFTVTATNAIGTSVASSASNSVTPTAPTTVPDAPTIGTATAGNAQATVAFTAPVSNGGSAITGYTVTSNPGNITGTGTASPITVTGLTNETAYTFTVTATNAIGTSVASSASNSVTPTAPGPITDNDGNVYNTVAIGTQVWMAENLKTTKYNDGTAIPNITDNTAWWALTTPSYCWYNNDATTYKATYGALYNWYTVDVASNGGKNVCPTSWHVPTDAEWTTLTTYLGGEYVAGGKLKEIGTTHWIYPNTGATNETGFSALPGGYRDYDGSCINVGLESLWWSSTEGSTDMFYGSAAVGRLSYYKQAGFFVRCVRDF